MRVFKKVMIVALIMIAIVISTNIVKADMGAKPSITIHLKNMKTTAYTIDLLTKNNPEEFNRKITDKYISYVDKAIYKYNKDGWVATTLRNSILWGNIEGNTERTHTFSYFGTPTEFKVIIQFADGKVKTSDVFKRNTLTYNMYLDVDTMTGSENEQTAVRKTDYITIAKCLIITIVVELIIALIMKIDYFETIIIVNIITQACLQGGLLLNLTSYLKGFIILEIGIFVFEYLIYSIFFTRVTNKKIFIYTLLANLATAYLTFIIK